jgi:hypothetical protein
VRRAVAVRRLQPVAHLPLRVRSSRSTDTGGRLT